MADQTERGLTAEELGVRIDYSQFITEDDTPLDSFYQEKQQRLLSGSLNETWAGPPQGQKWVAAANVGVFWTVREPAIVPDCFVSIGAERPDPSLDKRSRSYFVWDQGKPPDIVVEIVSRTKGGEDTEKIEKYLRVGVTWYVIYDPEGHLSAEPLRVFVRRGNSLELTDQRVFPEMGLGIAIWHGEFEDFTTDWLRWTDLDGNLILTGSERAALEAERVAALEMIVQQEKERADSEAERAELETRRAEQVTRQRDEARLQAEQEQALRQRLEGALRKLGVDPGVL